MTALRYLLVSGCFAGCAAYGVVANAATYDEATYGDLANEYSSGAAPTIILDSGINTISGTLTGGSGSYFPDTVDAIDLGSQNAVVNSIKFSMELISVADSVNNIKMHIHPNSTLLENIAPMIYENRSAISHQNVEYYSGAPIDLSTYDDLKFSFRFASASGNDWRSLAYAVAWTATIDATVVPIPATLPLMGGAIAALGLVGRNRLKRTNA